MGDSVVLLSEWLRTSSAIRYNANHAELSGSPPAEREHCKGRRSHEGFGAGKR